MPLAKKLKTVHGPEAYVSHKITKARNGIYVYEFQAVVGSTVHFRKMTMGAEDGPRRIKSPEIMAQEVQEAVDAERQLLADETAWREHMRLAIDKVV